MRLGASSKRLVRDTRGAEIAEAAAVLPLLVMLIFGILWFGRAFSIYTTLTRAAREAASAAATHTCGTCGNAVQSDAAILGNVVIPILNSAHLDPTQLQFDTIQHGVLLNPGSTPAVYGSIVTMRYPYTFRLNGVTCCPLTLTPINTGITITARAQAQEEN